MKRYVYRLVLAIFAVMTLGMQANAENATRVDNIIWAGDRLYGTILTPTSFVSPPARTLDILYNFDMSGLGGQRPVSESYPGATDYNGGKWSVKIAVFTESGKAALDADADGNIDTEITNSGMVLAHAGAGHIQLMDTTIYFQCPLLP